METTFHQSSMNETSKDILKTLEDASKPSRPETDNHETGFWKGAAIIAVAAAVGFGVIAYQAIKKD
jgi:hypothetical protein